MTVPESSAVITIDGPAGAGKSTIAKALAQQLNFSYLDTGAMYRALTLKALRTSTPLEDEEALVGLARKTTIDLKGNPAVGLKVFLDGQDVSEEIRSTEVTNNTFYIAQSPRVREIMVHWQREIGRRNNVVVEGRDIGTVVFPQAAHKFYLDADFNERSRRRAQELRDKGHGVDEAQLREALKERDQKDFTRKAGPLKKADDAVVIDSTHLTIPQVVNRIIEIIQSRQRRHG